MCTAWIVMSTAWIVMSTAWVAIDRCMGGSHFYIVVYIVHVCLAWGLTDATQDPLMSFYAVYSTEFLQGFFLEGDRYKTHRNSHKETFR